MQATVKSVNVGQLRPVPKQKRLSGIHKEPVDAIEVRDPGAKRGGLGSGVVDDAIGSRKHHGGSSQAVYAVAREELDWWGTELGRELPDGWFGENVTTIGFDVDAALVGEHWRLGDVALEVCGPRVPCATFAGHMGERAWVRRFTERGRTGAYLAVLTPGTITSGTPIEVTHQPDHGITVPMLFGAVMGDSALARRILDLGILRPDEHEWLASRVKT